MAAAEKKETLARKKKTEAALARLTAPDPDPESTDTSDAEQNVTAAILASLPMKKPTEQKSPAAKGPVTRGRKKKKD